MAQIFDLKRCQNLYIYIYSVPLYPTVSFFHFGAGVALGNIWWLYPMNEMEGHPTCSYILLVNKLVKHPVCSSQAYRRAFDNFDIAKVAAT